MSDDRPDPDQLLAQVQADPATRTRGTLKIFFGYAAGVGKTFAMLEYAQRAVAAGKDVVVGYIEPHARPETMAMLKGLEILPTKPFVYRSVVLNELDVDAALARHPEIILIDELAHSNAEGSRHSKRYQDVDELLDAGINVWTTLNVQHIESLNDVVGQITGINVRETVPDHIFDAADDIELVDITPEELQERLKAGKVYIPEQAQRAIQHFFQRSNLTALREMSLRQTAQRIHADVEMARRQSAPLTSWGTTDTLLVCLGPSPTTARVIRTAKRMSTALGARWIAVSVDQIHRQQKPADRQQLAEHFRLAERLGADTATLVGDDVAKTVLEYARSRNVTKIFIGKTNQPFWKRLLFGSVVDNLLDRSGEIDVYVIHGIADTPTTTGGTQTSPSNLWSCFMATCIVTLACLLGICLRTVRLVDAEANTIMIFLVAIVFAAYLFGSHASIWASILSVLLFDFFFVPPFHTFAVADAQYVVTFGVMLGTGLLISSLTTRHKLQFENARLREQHTAALYELGKQLGSLYGVPFLAIAAGQKIQEMTHGEVVIYIKRSKQTPEILFGQNTTLAQHPVSLPAAQWVMDHDQLAGCGTNTLPNAIGLFFPLIGSLATHGTLAIKVKDPQRLLEPQQRRLLETCASQLSLAMERDQLAVEASDARIQVETEQIRSNLLSSVSHDFKTPLAVIAGAATTLLEPGTLSEATKLQLLQTIDEEAHRLNRLLENILQMSKLDAKAPTNKDWNVIEDIIGSALHRLSKELAQHQVQIELPPDLPLVFVDSVLVEQIFMNLLENAVRYTPPGTTIWIKAQKEGAKLQITVADNGPGIPPGLEEKIFERFYRGDVRVKNGRGSGLGLAICRSIARLHGGDVIARRRSGDGVEFLFTLPLHNNAPQVHLDT